METPIAHVCYSIIMGSATDQTGHVFDTYIMFLIPLAEQKQIYVM